MSIVLVELSVADSLDLSAHPNRDTALIPEHFVYYCSKFDPLPAIGIEIDGSRIIVKHGHSYVTAARSLGRPRLRAVVSSPAARADVAAFLQRPDVKRLNVDEIRAREDADPIPQNWHVFFFARPLSAAEKSDFDERVGRLFDRWQQGGAIRVHHDDARALAEFEAKTPVTDHAWARDNLASFSEFNRTRAPIVSYAGRRFPG